MTKRITLLVCLLIATLSFSQRISPIKVLIDGVEYVAISEIDVQKINITYLERNMYKSINDSLYIQVDYYKKMHTNSETSIDKLLIADAKSKTIIENQKKTIGWQLDTIDVLEVVVAKRLKKIKRNRNIAISSVTMNVILGGLLYIVTKYDDR